MKPSDDSVLDDLPDAEAPTVTPGEDPIPMVPVGEYGEISMANLTVRKFPDSLRHTIEHIAAQRRMTPDDWIIEQCLATLGQNGFDPCPTWRPALRKA